MLISITGAVQHYEWGGHEFIPALLGQPTPSARPCAELWLGAHPAAPATAANGETLDRVITFDPAAILGPRVNARYSGQLPYLLKVLDAHSMLSIQAHPNKLQAEAGFARENAAAIPRNAPNRNYKDDNHKPEVHVALSEFWMLHSFRPLTDLAAALEQVPEFATLLPFESVRALYETVMTLPQPEVEAMLALLVARLEREAPTDRDHPDFWALRAARQYGLDRGLFSIYLLNLLHLAPGQGTYQPAGVLHAYLEGVNVELMANSDNVLRGGLTPKHVDADELMRTLSFECAMPEVLTGEPSQAGEMIYRTAAAEFELSRIALDGTTEFRATAEGPDTLIVLEGAVAITSGESRTLARGQAVVVPHGESYAITASAPATLYRAVVPR